MLVLGLVRDVLGILEGRGHVAGRGELLLDAADLALAHWPDFFLKNGERTKMFFAALLALSRCGVAGVLAHWGQAPSWRSSGPTTRTQDFWPKLSSFLNTLSLFTRFVHVKFEC